MEWTEYRVRSKTYPVFLLVMNTIAFVIVLFVFVPGHFTSTLSMVLNLALYTVSAAGQLSHYFMCFITNPGYITSAHPFKPLPSAAHNICRVCRMVRPQRAHHCRVCNRCVLRMDHHCYWVDTCVGQGNHKFFLGFLFFATSTTMHFLVLFGTWLWHTYSLAKGALTEALVLIFSSILLPLAGVVACFFAWTCWLACQDKTTLEWTYPSRAEVDPGSDNDADNDSDGDCKRTPVRHGGWSTAAEGHDGGPRRGLPPLALFDGVAVSSSKPPVPVPRTPFNLRSADSMTRTRAVGRAVSPPPTPPAVSEGQQASQHRSRRQLLRDVPLRLIQMIGWPCSRTDTGRQPLTLISFGPIPKAPTSPVLGDLRET